MLNSHIRKIEERGEELAIPDFTKGLEWFNTAPLSFKEQLKNKIVVLDFWTYCCINCMHVLPDLAALEKKYAADPVVFIGVHSPKFANEHHSENIRQAILRYDISHPVVNDSTMSMWKAVGISSWPSFLVIGPKGNMIFSASGEGQREKLDAYISAILNYYPRTEFNTTSLPIVLEKDRQRHASPLRFPGKLAVDKVNNRLFISDSNHNRILVSTLDGHIQTVIGSGEAALRDGSYHQASFYRPQGIAYQHDTLYVADTENHALRKIDLANQVVTTLAGNGTQGFDYRGGGKGHAQQLSSPWDVALDPNENRLFIAMAGTHQIWNYDFTTERARNFSGNGREENSNSDDLLDASWAQPSGLSFHDHLLFVADSESSTIRSLHIPDGPTDTLVGGDSTRPYNLFSFGDRDGSRDNAKLQHPLGVLWIPSIGRLVIADTYNHKLKLVNPTDSTIISWVGTGKAGYRDGPKGIAQLAEPSGLALSPDGQTIFVADTNNHLIRKIDIHTGNVSTLNIKNTDHPKNGIIK